MPRALVVEPEVLFMDEPFSALDVLTAENLRSELLELWQNKTIPTRAIFLVTHNIEEAVLLADRIIVLDEGRIAGIGTHKELYKNCEVYQEIVHSQLSENEIA